MNDSTSAPSPVWPTRWANSSFRGIGTWLLAGFLAALFVVPGIAGLKPGQVPFVMFAPWLIYVVLVLLVVLDGIPLLITLLAMPRISKFSLRELGFRAPSAADIRVALVAAIAAAIVLDGGTVTIEHLTHSQHQQDVMQILTQVHTWTALAAFAALSVIFAPIAEETVFRVFFFNLGLRYAGFWYGAVLSGILFGVAHGDPYFVLPLALTGIVLCVVYYRTRNAYASMITHATFNAIAFVWFLAALPNVVVPAQLAQIGNPPKMGSETAVVQVEVNADGSHRAVKVIRSAKPSDNAAAMEMAQNANYVPAYHGMTPVTSFRNFTFDLQQGTGMTWPLSLHFEAIVEVNKMGNVVRVTSTTPSSIESMNRYCYRNALQMWIHRPNGTAQVGLYRVSYDFNPFTRKLVRSVALISSGGSWGDAPSAVQRQLHSAAPTPF